MIRVTDKKAPRGAGLHLSSTKDITGIKKLTYASSRIAQHPPFDNTARLLVFAARIVGEVKSVIDVTIVGYSYAVVRNRALIDILSNGHAYSVLNKPFVQYNEHPTIRSGPRADRRNM
jgi:hypothetical protein